MVPPPPTTSPLDNWDEDEITTTTVDTVDMAVSNPDANMEGKFVGQATKDDPALASVDASNPTGYMLTVLMSHARA